MVMPGSFFVRYARTCPGVKGVPVYSQALTIFPNTSQIFGTFYHIPLFPQDRLTKNLVLHSVDHGISIGFSIDCSMQICHSSGTGFMPNWNLLSVHSSMISLTKMLLKFLSRATCILQ